MQRKKASYVVCRYVYVCLLTGKLEAVRLDFAILETISINHNVQLYPRQHGTIGTIYTLQRFLRYPVVILVDTIYFVSYYVCKYVHTYINECLK